MLSNSAAARDIEHILHGYVDLKKYRESGPTIMTGGKGIYVYDENGTPYIEGVGGMWCTSLGFGEKELIEAAVEQFHKLPYYYMGAYKSVNPAIDLAERLSEIVPVNKPKIYFALSGSEANDFLVKFIRYYNNSIGRPLKKKVISRHMGYHGATAMSGSLSGLPVNHMKFDLPLPGILHTANPNYYHDARDGESPAEFGERLARELEEMILREGPETVAAFIAEPVAGAGGVVIPPAPYYAKVQEVLQRHDVLFLADEVITGFHRTGELWGCNTMGIKPDTMTLAKGISSAYLPLAALVLPDEIYQGLEKGSSEIGFFGHGTTYSGHPVCCAVGLKVLDIIRERNLGEHVKTVSKRFIKRLNGFRDHPMVGDVRAVGLVGAVEFVANKRTKTFFNPPGAFARRVRELAEQKYHMICRLLPGSDACAFSPPIIITEAEIDEMFDRFGRALDEVTAEYARENNGLPA